jgi:hypothetical protein
MATNFPPRAKPFSLDRTAQLFQRTDQMMMQGVKLTLVFREAECFESLLI